jgi:hypothetical protein
MKKPILFRKNSNASKHDKLPTSTQFYGPPRILGVLDDILLAYPKNNSGCFETNHPWSLVKNC